MTIRQALKEAQKLLYEKNVETPVKEAGVLLAFVLGRDISYLYTHPDNEVSPDKLLDYRECVRKRGQGMPFSYITRNKEFMSLDFYVTPHCLIPRPETEVLVENALSWIRQSGLKCIRVLDIGTGSGAIAVSLAHYAQNVFVDAVDLSTDAIGIASVNAKKHKVDNRIQFIQADFLTWESLSPYSLVLSNPPYIPSEEVKDLMDEVKKYEPMMALVGGADGLLFYRAIARRVGELLSSKGATFMEVGKGQADAVERMFRAEGLQTEVIQDYSGVGRVIRASMP